MNDGGTALVVELSSPLALPAEDWQPFELMGVVSRSGQVGELVVTSSSGSEEIDDFFRFHLKKNMRIDDRLRPGFYVLRIGP
jgi:hypothetical protein